MYKPYRHINSHSVIKAWSAATFDHRAEPDQQPAPRPLNYRVQIGAWQEQPRAHRDQHRKRDHQRRKQKQVRQNERAVLQTQLKSQH